MFIIVFFKHKEYVILFLLSATYIRLPLEPWPYRYRTHSTVAFSQA